MPDKPVPLPSAETRGFWEACARGELTAQHCPACGAWQHYPRSFCGSCGNTALEQRRVSGEGEILSFTINRVPVSEAFADDVPYAVVLVTLAEGPVMMANLVDSDLDDLCIGAQVEVCFEARGEQSLPQFRLR